MRIAPAIELTETEEIELNRIVKGRRSEVRQVSRAKIVLLAAKGLLNQEIAAQLGISETRVGRWRTRYSTERVAGIVKDRPRGGRRPAEGGAVASRIIEKTTQSRPSNATHWSTRSLAAELGVTQSMVARVWKANGLKPHLVKTFKLSNDVHFEAKLRDVVGLYLNPPENAIVISADEKTSIQALDRTQPSLPMVKGRCGTLTHDYKRNGTTTLFAAISMACGTVISTCMKRHRHQEWIKFLKKIEEGTEAGLAIHLIVDNYATHKHANVKKWLERHPRFHVHFIPTSSSWLNVIERFFRDLDVKRLRRGVFRSVPDLIEAIRRYVDEHNANPRAIIWRATADKILEKVGRARRALDNLKTA